MTRQKKLTQVERNQRRAILDEFHEKIKTDPERVERREWIKEAFKGDIDAICNFAASLMIEGARAHEENENLIKKLNEIYITSHGLSSATELPGYVKFNIAKLGLEINSEDPVVLAFMAGGNVSKQLQARKNANKGHAKNLKARKFVQHEWATHKDAYYKNKSDFARAYVRRIKNEYNVDITEKQMREVWLADTPSASKQAG